MPKYDERIDPNASLVESMDVTHMTEETKHKLSNVLTSMFTDKNTANSKDQKFQ
jgi:hypothetical protein